MKITVKIEGMHCGHCSARVKNAIEEFKGASAAVDLENKQAVIDTPEDIPDKVLEDTINDLGFEFISASRS
ncbi:MAG: heavy-metal-associated domain-containing protein [Clostridiales bacterium]|nr:heavy-metal-associated domain-containing protein [Clostridiales bacterium]